MNRRARSAIPLLATLLLAITGAPAGGAEVNPSEVPPVRRPSLAWELDFRTWKEA